MKNTQTHYLKLKKISYDLHLLQGINHLLDWDQETYMPKGAGPIRAEQRGLLSYLIQKKITSKSFTNHLKQLIDISSGKIIAKGLNSNEKINLKRWLRDYKKAISLPAAFVQKFSSLTSKSTLVWSKAKKQNAFNQFAPYLEKIVSLCKEKADYLGYEKHPYDALLDEYEPNATTKDLTKLFTSLQKPLKSILNQILKKKKVNASFLHKKFPLKKQIQFAEFLLDHIQFPKEYGRLDLSIHPFSSSSHPTDSRITTRVDENNFFFAISSVLHEAGHSFYEMQLPKEAFGTPLGESISLGIHESQSRFWETCIGQSLPFWKYFYPFLKKSFKKQLEGISLNRFYQAINHVQPSMIRTEADEVTYCLHVILRFEIERDLIGGDLKVRDIPDVWNAKMKNLLGVAPKNNREGCLQDIHWAMGGFGYFPTYALGNLYATQFFHQFKKDHPLWEKQVSKGEFSFIKNWLKENIHQHGRRYESCELIKKVTKKPLSIDPYLSYLKEKYL